MKFIFPYIRTLFIVLILTASSQNNDLRAQESLEIILLDKIDNNPISFAHISSENNEISALSNEDGSFSVRLPLQQNLTITHIQYQPFLLTNKELRDTIFLLPSNYQIEAIEVLADDNKAFRFIKKCKKVLKKQNIARSCKSYLSLQTHIDNLPQEFIEGYYNSSQRQGMLHSLDLKAGRIAMAPDSLKRYFVTISNTKAILFHDLLSINSNYPINPFSTNRIRKRYAVASFIESKKDVYIKLVPKVKGPHFFEMEITMDKLSYAPKLIELYIPETNVHPFIPINGKDLIDKMSLRIKNQYTKYNDQLVLELINFENQYRYHDKSRKFEDVRNISTNAIVFNYKIDEEFLIPLFEYSPDHNDYRKISFFPFNNALLNETRIIDYSSFQKKSLEYFKTNGFIVNFYDKQWNMNGKQHEFFEENNIIWSKSERWALKPKSFDINKTDIMPPSKVEIQHLIDATKTKDSVQILSRNIIDIFQSKYYLNNEPHEMAYINIAFDLSEIELRKTLSKIENLKDLKEIEQIFQIRKQEWEDYYRTYRRETNYGKNLKNLSKYNEIVLIELGINNFTYFKITPN